MTDYTGYGTDPPPGLVWQNDPGAYTFGQSFRVDTNGLSVKQIRFYVPDGTTDAPTSGYEVALWEVGNTTPVRTVTGVSAVVGAWNEVDITEYPVVTGADYRAGVLFPGGYYGADVGEMPNDVPGPINFYESGRFNSGGTLTYPNTSSGTNPWYGVDITLTDGESDGETATLAIVLPSLASSLAGQAALTATLGITLPGLDLALSAAGPATGFSADRADLVALLAGIDGVTALQYPSGTPAQGQAWPLLGEIDMSSYGVATWHVVFVAGGDGRTAERWLDANLVAVLDALRPFMYVDTVTPVDLGNNVVGVQFAGRREIR